MGYQHCSKLRVIVGGQILLAECISLESLLSLGSVLLFLVRRRDIFPGLPSTIERTAIWSPFLHLSPLHLESVAIALLFLILSCFPLGSHH